MASSRDQLKAALKQKLKEQLLQRQEQPKSVGGFLSNLGKDVREISSGVAALVSMPFAKAYQFASQPDFRKEQIQDFKSYITSPSQTIRSNIVQPGTQIGKQVASSFGQSFTGTARALGASKLATGIESKFNIPSTKGKNVLYERPLQTVLDISTVLPVTGQLGAVTKGITAGTKLSKVGEVAGKVGKSADIISELATPTGAAKATLKVAKRFPKFEKIITSGEQALEASKTLQKSQYSHILTRNERINQIENAVKRLSDAEASSLIPVAEGRATALNPTQHFDDAITILKNISGEREHIGLKLKKFTPDQLKSRKYQPITKATGKGIEEINKLFPDIDPIYVQHLFDDPKKFSDFFINTQPVKTFKPSFLKRSTGATGYIGRTGADKAQLSDVLGRMSSQTLKWENTINLVEEIKNKPYTKEFNMIKDEATGKMKFPDVPEGYRIFAPDGLLNFYRTSVDFAKSASKSMENMTINDAVAKSVDDVLKTLPDKSFLSVAKRQKLYIVPESVANVISSSVTPASPFVKLFIDRPTDFFKSLALSVPRFVVNNTIGSVLFQTLSGAAPRPRLIKAMVKRNLIPKELINANLFRSESTMAGKLGSVESSIQNKIIKTALGGISLPLKAAKSFSDIIMKINSLQDDFVKANIYINEVMKAQRIPVIKRYTQNMETTLSMMEKSLNNPELVNAAVARTENLAPSFSSLLPIERNVIRRVFPFYSWLKWSTGYAERTFFHERYKGALLSNTAKFINEITGSNKLPGYLKGSIPIGMDEEGNTVYFRTSGINPFQLLSEASTKGIGAALANAVSPAGKVLQEQVTGRDVFTGKTFTQKGIVKPYGSDQFFKMNPETGKIEQTEPPKPGILESTLRAYIPYYQNVEDIISTYLLSADRYTAANMGQLLGDVFKPESERQASYVSKQQLLSGKPNKEFDAINFLLRIGGIPVMNVEKDLLNYFSTQEKAATNALFKQTFPSSSITKEDIKEALKQKLRTQMYTKGSK